MEHVCIPNRRIFNHADGDICILLIKVYFFLERPAPLFPVYDFKYKTPYVLLQTVTFEKI
jgi:hypothetical protein